MYTMTRRKRFTDEYKAQAVALVHAGRSVRDVAGELGISKSNLHRWVANQESAQLRSEGGGAAGGPTEAEELRRLRREVADLRLDNDILKKAAIILGRDERPGPGS